MEEYFENYEWDEEDFSEYGEYDEYDEYEEVEGDLSRFPAYPVKLEGVQYGIFISDILISCGLASSEREAERMINEGRLTVNNEVVPKVECILTEEDFWEGYITIEKEPDEGRYIVLDL